MTEKTSTIGLALFNLRLKILESDSLGIDWTVCDRVAKHLEELDKDSERLDKLQELIKGPGCVSFLYVETAPSHITIIEETGRHDEFVGTGPDLRSAIDSVKP